jgi:undecaprenyl-diphosphatase
MIDLLPAVLLGIIQGLTEFIPVSSTAHLRIVPALLSMPDPGAAYSAVIQLGTLVSLIAYFYRDLMGFAAAFFSGIRKGQLFEDEKARMVWYLGAGTVPIAVLGLLFASAIKGELRSLYVISASLVFFALVLWAVDHFSRKEREIHGFNLKDALLIGLAQSLALIPGASRSGVTLMMGLMLGFRRDVSMRLSFLLSIPAVALSGLYELYDERHALMEAGMGGLVVATVVSAVVGYASVAFLLRYLRTHNTGIFVGYRIGLGIGILFLLYKGALVAM